MERIRNGLTLMFLPPAWRIACFAMLGVLAGILMVAARLSRATSYLSDNPDTCINCHVMNDAYLSWQHGSHGRVAKCVDCHIPHTNPVAMLAFKAQDGMKHSTVFTMHSEPQVLQLSKGAIPVVQNNCLRCHDKQFAMIRLAGTRERRCWDCHENIHGPVRSLSASPREMMPRLPSAGMPFMNDKKKAK
jgi:cytochrome c nitrite reductase small subunit